MKKVLNSSHNGVLNYIVSDYYRYYGRGGLDVMYSAEMSF